MSDPRFAISPRHLSALKSPPRRRFSLVSRGSRSRFVHARKNSVPAASLLAPRFDYHRLQELRVKRADVQEELKTACEYGRLLLLENEEMRANVKRLPGSIREVEEDTERLRKETEGLEFEVADLHHRLSRFSDLKYREKSLETQFNNLEETRFRLIRTKNRLEQSRKTLRSDLESLRRRDDSVRERISVRSRELEHLKHEVGRKATSVRDLARRVNQNEEHLSQYESVVAERVNGPSLSEARSRLMNRARLRQVQKRSEPTVNGRPAIRGTPEFLMLCGTVQETLKSDVRPTLSSFRTTFVQLSNSLFARFHRDVQGLQHVVTSSISSPCPITTSTSHFFTGREFSNLQSRVIRDLGILTLYEPPLPSFLRSSSRSSSYSSHSSSSHSMFAPPHPLSPRKEGLVDCKLASTSYFLSYDLKWTRNAFIVVSYRAKSLSLYSTCARRNLLYRLSLHGASVKRVKSDELLVQECPREFHGRSNGGARRARKEVFLHFREVVGGEVLGEWVQFVRLCIRGAEIKCGMGAGTREGAAGGESEDDWSDIEGELL